MSTLIVNKRTAASGKGLTPGEYQVPGDVSEQDARILVGLRRAVWKEPAERVETAEAEAGESATMDVVKPKRRASKPRPKKTEG